MNSKLITREKLIELFKEADMVKLKGVIVSVMLNLHGEIVLIDFDGNKTIMGPSVKYDLLYSPTRTIVKTIFGDISIYRLVGLPMEIIEKKS